MRSNTQSVVRAALAVALVFAMSWADEAKGAAPAVVVAKTSDADLVLNVRLLLARRAAKDPIKLAVHVKTAAAGRIDLAKTFASLTFELIGPDGKTRRLQADVRDDRAKWKKEQSLLARNATWLMDVTAEGFRTQLELTGQWRGKARPDLTRPGAYQVRFSGRLALVGRKAVDFKSPALVSRVEKDYWSVAEFEKSAMEAISRHLPAFKPAKKHWTESGYVQGLVYADGDGNRVIQRNGQIRQRAWSYDLARVVISPRGKVLSVAHRNVGTCIATGTPIDTPRGPVRVEMLREGDCVWGYDVKRARRVATTIRTIRRSVVAHTLRIGPSLRVTGNHPVWTPAGWLPAGQVRRTHRLMDARGRWSAAGRLRRVTGRVAVFDLTVAAPHTYFAGGVLVHNKSRPWHHGLDDPWYFYWPAKPHKFSVVYEAADRSAAMTTKASAEVAALIAQLGHDSYKVRQSASEALKKMGKAVVPMLQEARKRKGLDPEIAHRIDAILGTAPAGYARTATDPATGVVVSVEPDGSLAARIHGKMLWRLKSRQEITGLKIVGRRILAQPNDMEIDLRTGKLLRIGGPGRR